jgi:hypothetical protein
MVVSPPMDPVLVVIPVEPSMALLVQWEVVVPNMVIVGILPTIVEWVANQLMGVARRCRLRLHLHQLLWLLLLPQASVDPL